MNGISKMKVLFVWIAALAIVALSIIMICVKANNTKVFKSYKDIEKSSYVIKDIAGQDESEYYVFIYSSKDDYEVEKKEALEDIVTRYFTFAHQNKNDDTVKKIYAYDTSKFKSTTEFKNCASYLSSLNSSINITDAPVLVLVSGGAVSSVYKTIGGSSGIEATLSNAIVAAQTTEE